jgi:hypothetical protein
VASRFNICRTYPALFELFAAPVTNSICRFESWMPWRRNLPRGGEERHPEMAVNSCSRKSAPALTLRADGGIVVPKPAPMRPFGSSSR